MKYDLIVIGSGPAGYVAAIRAGQTGLKTLVIDEKYVGGMCLNWGCIPTKSILESAKLLRKIKQSANFGIAGINPDELSYDWTAVKKRTEGIVRKLSKGIEFLWKKNGVEYLKGRAKIISETQVEVEKQIFETKYIIIATGSKPAYTDLFAADSVVELEQFYAQESLPKKPLVFGSSALAVEMAQFFKLIGHDPLLLLNRYPILTIEDKYLNTQLEKIIKKEKIAMYKLDEVSISGNKLLDQDQEYEFDKVINCSLRVATLPESESKLKLDNGFIKVNQNLQSSSSNIYAVGDVNGLSFLAHSASAQGLAAVNHINGQSDPIDISLHPLNIYTDPEIAHIGLSEEMLKAQGQEYKVSEYFFAANGKALIEGNSEGSVRMLYEPKYSQVLGVQIVGANATDMISEASVLMELEGTIYDVARAIHAHPTVSEVFMEAGLKD